MTIWWRLLGRDRSFLRQVCKLHQYVKINTDNEYTLCLKNMWLHLRRSVELELSVYNNFWHTYYQEYKSLTDFLFSHHTY